jgi:hypothetical protein
MPSFADMITKGAGDIYKGITTTLDLYAKAETHQAETESEVLWKPLGKKISGVFHSAQKGMLNFLNASYLNVTSFFHRPYVPERVTQPVTEAVQTAALNTRIRVFDGIEQVQNIMSRAGERLSFERIKASLSVDAFLAKTSEAIAAPFQAISRWSEKVAKNAETIGKSAHTPVKANAKWLFLGAGSGVLLLMGLAARKPKILEPAAHRPQLAVLPQEGEGPAAAWQNRLNSEASESAVYPVR